MRLLPLFAAAALATALCAQEKPAATTAAPVDPDAQMLRRIYDAALVDSPAYENLRELTTRFPGRLAGSPAYHGAEQWGEEVLKKIGCDRTELQPTMVPHWERGAAESVRVVRANGQSAALSAVALGGSVPTPAGGLTAPVVELHSLDELATADVKGKIVFFNGAMNPRYVNPGQAYGESGRQRNQGPAEAAKHGAVGVLVRSLTHRLDDVPHTGNTTYLPDVPRIPAAALSTVAANELSTALKADSTLQVAMQINSSWHDDWPAANVIGEIRGSESPEKIILVGGHLDSWDIAPGAHDDGAGIVQSIDVLRILKTIGYTPKHTIRAVLFAGEENSLRGAIKYAEIAGEKKEVHLLALETDGGGFSARGFNIGNAAGDAHLKAARFKPLFEPYGVFIFQAGRGGADVGPLMAKGNTVAGLIPEAQRYFDIHHTREDTIDKVNKRELELGTAAMAALIYLVDQHGL
ncbi:MAG: M20/M25/M40 family metallo-hydrolase [Candidatus Didemnitutus sp.]|nr:M20/M25/M40 family metallo-hydrolase [Candidatus Didemnitutus sp.]